MSLTGGTGSERCDFRPVMKLNQDAVRCESTRMEKQIELLEVGPEA